MDSKSLHQGLHSPFQHQRMYVQERPLIKTNIPHHVLIVLRMFFVLESLLTRIAIGYVLIAQACQIQLFLYVSATMWDSLVTLNQNSKWHMLEAVPLGRAIILPKLQRWLAMIRFLRQRRMCLCRTCNMWLHLCYTRGIHLFPQLLFNFHCYPNI